MTMDRQTFFDNFAHIAEAPNGVKKLRELILQMAVQGKLVPQDSSDEPAAKLLERIREEKARLVKAKKIRKNEPLAPITADEVPYDLPQGWVWVRLGDIAEYDAAVKVEPKNIPDDGWLLELEDIEKDTSKILQRRTFEEKQSLSNKARFFAGDVLYGKLRPYLNKVIVADANGYCTTEIISIRDYCGLNSYFLKYTLKSPRFLDYVNAKTYGVKMPRLGTDDGRKALFSLPPEKEQHRIVAKVDQLMTLCDELEAKQQRTRVKLTLLNNAALDRLTSARAVDDFTAAWHLLRDNFDLLYTTPETIAKLRQGILQLAVQGKLVEQAPNDEPASVLLEKIKAEKERLVKEKKIRKSDPLPPVTADEAPYGLPKGWEWVRLGEIIAVMDSGWSPACHDWATRDDDTWGVLKTTAVQSLEYRNYEHKELPSNLSPRPEYEVNKGDILITRAGPKNRVGICCLVKETRHKLMISDKIIRFNLAGEIIFDGFIALCLNAGGSKDYIENQKSGMAESQMNVTQPKLKLTPVAIPPYDEQHRIVAKVEQLMSLCDRLESRLMKAEAKAEKLTTAAVQGLLIA
jgi:type I restriction enzyme S subunit